MQLTKSQAHYIKAVYELSTSCDDGVRVCDVAKKLNVSKASASLAIVLPPIVNTTFCRC